MCQDDLLERFSKVCFTLGYNNDRNTLRHCMYFRFGPKQCRGKNDTPSKILEVF